MCVYFPSNSVSYCKGRVLAGVAQLVEQRFCKPLVGGSIPLAGSFTLFRKIKTIFSESGKNVGINGAAVLGAVERNFHASLRKNTFKRIFSV